MCLLVIALTSPVKAQSRGYVVVQHIEDGDTFLTSDGEWIRLAGIDCPEDDSKKGRFAEQFLRVLIGDKRVFIDRVGEGHYGRTLAYVYHDNLIVNSLLLEQNLAVIYGKE